MGGEAREDEMKIWKKRENLSPYPWSLKWDYICYNLKKICNEIKSDIDHYKPIDYSYLPTFYAVGMSKDQHVRELNGSSFMTVKLGKWFKGEKERSNRVHERQGGTKSNLWKRIIFAKQTQSSWQVMDLMRQ